MKKRNPGAIQRNKHGQATTLWPGRGLGCCLGVGGEASLNLSSAPLCRGVTWASSSSPGACFLRVTHLPPEEATAEQNEHSCHYCFTWHFSYKFSSKWGKINQQIQNHPRILISFSPCFGTLPENFRLTRHYRKKAAYPLHHSQRGSYPNPSLVKQEKRDPPSS